MSTAGCQRGSSLIEVLVALLVLSLGLLGASSLLAYAAQMPRLAGHRATAVQLAAAHVERMRANAQGPFAGSDTTPQADALAPSTTGAGCRWPACTPPALALMDLAEARQTVRQQLPQGQLVTRCNDTPCGRGALGDVWVVWQEPPGFASLQGSGHDECPPGLLPEAPLQCIHLRFSL